jgi:hypothetical protein
VIRTGISGGFNCREVVVMNKPPAISAEERELHICGGGGRHPLLLRIRASSMTQHASDDRT